MCDINDPRILNAYIAITEYEPTNWLILGYKDTRDVISLYSSGTHGLGEFRDNLTSEILFGFVRVEDKFILITYVPDSVSGVRRARALVHSRTVAGVLELSHTQFTASTLSDLSDANVRTRLKLGENQVPNRPRSVTKRASFVHQQRRRRSGTYSPSPSPSPISERNLKIHLNTTEEPYSYEDSSDRMTATPTPSTPTSVTSSYNNDTSYFAVVDSSAAASFSAIDEQERKRLQDHTEAMLQFQLAKKKELEEARFRQFQRDQQEERFKQQQAIKRMEEEQRRQSLMQQQKAQKQKELPKWQQELIQRKLKKQQQMLEQQQQQPQSSTPLQQPQPIVTLKKTQVAVPSPKSSQIEVASPLSPQPNQKGASLLVKQPSRTDLPNHSKEGKAASVIDALKPVSTASPSVARQASSVPAPSATTVSPPAPVPTPAPTEVKASTIMTGFVSIQTTSSRFWKRRYFVISSRSLLLYKDEDNTHPMFTVDHDKVKRVAPVDEDEDAYVPNSFMIDTQQGENYQLLADDKKTSKQIYATLKQQALSAH